MKHVLLYVSAIVLVGLISFCKNTPGANNAADSSAALPPDRTDSLFGITGSDRAGFHAISSTEREFVYQDFKVWVGPNENGGEDIRAIPTDGPSDTLTIYHEGPSYFRGAARGQILVEEDKPDSTRELAVYHVKKSSLMFRTPFCGDMEITSNGNLKFMAPIEESEVTKLPECPEKEEWAKKGLKVGYGQVCLFSLPQRTLTRKSEYACVPVK